MSEIPEGVFCKCGKRSVVFDTWFMYYPCEDHNHLSARDYSIWEDTNETPKR